MQRRDGSMLEVLQLGILCAVLVVSATTFRRVLWVATSQADLFADFQGVVLFMSDFALLVLLALTGLRMLTDPGFRRAMVNTVRTLGLWAALLWAVIPAWMLISALWAQQPILSIYDALDVFAMGIAALLVVYFVRSGMTRPLLISLIGAACVQSVIGVAQLLHGGPLGLAGLGEIRWIPPVAIVVGVTPSGLYRANGLTVNPNNLAGYLMLALFGLFALIAMSREPSRRDYGWFVAALLIIMVGLLATMSRGAIFPVLLGVALLVAWLVRDRWRLLLRQRLALLLGSAVIVLAVVAILSLNLRDRLLNIVEDVQDRAALLSQAGEVIGQHSILGVGAGNLMLQVEQNRLREDPYAALTAAVPAHNVYVILLAELGPLGVILCIAGWAAILIRMRRGGLSAVIWACALLAVFVSMLADYYFWYDHRSRAILYFAIGMAWAAALPEQPATEP